MSYDIRIAVKVEGCDKYADIASPEYDNPTYNLGEMFRKCMEWDFEQGQYYNASEIMPNIEKGIHNLRTCNYSDYEPPNGWGSQLDAIKVVDSMWKCIHQQAEEIPIECLYVKW